MVTGSDVLDNLSDFAASIATFDLDTVAALSRDVIEVILSRTADNLDERNIRNLKRFFGLIPAKEAQTLWGLMLGSAETKRVAMPWQHDAEFCNVLRTIYGVAS